MSAPARVIALAGLARSGKDTVADVLVSQLKADRYAFAEPMKTMLSSVFGSHFHTGDRERICPEAGVSYRYLMQTLGTEWGRNLIGQDLWVNLVDRRFNDGRIVHERFSLTGSQPYTLVLTDCRFASEVAWIKSKGGIVIYVDRPGNMPVGSAHQSEADETRELADLMLVNDGSLDDLLAKARQLGNSLSWT